MSNTENNLFRWFVMGWMSIAGVVMFLYMGLSFLGVGEDGLKNMLCFAPLSLLGGLIYCYVKNKDKLLKKLCLIYVIIGVPFMMLMFIAPIVMWQG